MTRWGFDGLLLRVGAVLVAICVGSLSLARHLAKAGDERLWTES